MSRAFRLGITGKIGSGKSTLSYVARKNGIKVLEADIIAKQVMATDSEVINKIESFLGNEAYKEGILNRSFLASKIFTDDSLRIAIEEIVHPATLKVIEKEFQLGRPGEIIALESAILFQTGLDEIFDAVILIDTADENAISRASASGKIAPEDARNRLSQQHYLEEWKEDADFVILNNGSEDEFIKRSESLIIVIKIIANQELSKESLRSIVE